MSKYSITELHEGTRISGKPAWHYSGADLAQLEQAGYYFPNGPVPEAVAMELVGWQPVSFTLATLVDPATMTAYAVPDRLSKVVARPGKGVINIAGDGYNENLHNVMADNLRTALSGGYTTEAAVCLGDGDFLGVTLIPTDDVVISGDYGSLRMRLAMVSSLTGKIATGLVKTGIRGECDNTIAAQLATAIKSMMVKRTRNSDARVTPGDIRREFDIAFADLQGIAAEMEMFGNIGVTEDHLRQILDIWQPLIKPDGTAKEGRGLTMASDTRGTLVNLFSRDPRRIPGENVASLLNAHNTWSHWNQISRGSENRIARQMERTATGEVGKADAAFMAIVAGVIPEVSKLLVPV